VEVKTPTREERIANHLRGIKMSFIPAVLGAAAGFLSSPYVLSPVHQSFSILILALAVYAQKYILSAWGLESNKFDAKAWIYLAFMTFVFWYVSWTIIVNGLPKDATTGDLLLNGAGNPMTQFGPFF
jgi:hypothetical protein